MIVTKEMFICVLDFEATCEDQSPIHEVIEFPSVLCRWTYQFSSEKPKDIIGSYLSIISEFQEFVKPKRDPMLSKFCKDLTHITQEQVDNGRPFPIVLQAHYQWLQEMIPNFFEQDVYMLTVGNWDLLTMAPIEYKIHNLTPDQVPPVYLRFINIKREFKHLISRGKRSGGRGGGLAAMLTYFRLNFIGHPHSGIDDCRNTVRVFEKMLERGYFLNGQSIIRVPFGSRDLDYNPFVK